MTVADRLRAVLPTELRVLGSRLRRANRAERADVERHMTIPPSLTPARRRPGSVWGVAMMRNEEDTARHVIEHLFAQGVDAVLVADNDSTDGTAAVLSSLAETHPVHIVQDRLVAYTQATKMNMLSSIARRSGADWIVPFDADELWFAADRPLADMLRATDVVVVGAAIHNVFPRADDDAGQADPFLRLRHVDTERSSFRKVAFRAHPLAKIEMGNLDVARRGRRTDGLFIAHFPWRSFDQMAAKLRHGRTAMEATDMPEQICDHWRAGGAWPEDRLTAAWDDLLAGRAVEQLVWSPAGELRLATPGTASTWSELYETAGRSST